MVQNDSVEINRPRAFISLVENEYLLFIIDGQLAIGKVISNQLEIDMLVKAQTPNPVPNDTEVVGQEIIGAGTSAFQVFDELEQEKRTPAV
nr:13590_t:CDS:2 [Entrophospora candida]CAG8481314.1 7300_t:CDS:2 [Entrophospora candida]